MKIIKIVLMASCTLAVMSAFGAASAAAESTQLCTTDTQPCTVPAKSFHFVDKAATLLSSTLNITCEELLSGEATSLGSPQKVNQTLTFSNCKSGANACKVNLLKEELGEVLREGTELGTWHFHFEFLWECAPFFHCVFGFWIWGHFLGPLLAGGNGKITFSQVEVNKKSGTFCPSTAKFDSVLESLSLIYIKS